jgi:hypothetical protein
MKVGFLGVSEADCRKVRIEAKPIVGNKCVLPTSLVEQYGARQLVRLSLDLAPWVIECVALANAGRNPFPSQVEFGELDGRCSPSSSCSVGTAMDAPYTCFIPDGARPTWASAGPSC